jgi:hypothetical protein
MDKVSLSIIIDELDRISINLYEEKIDGVDASFEIDKVIDNLVGWLKYLK